MDKKQIITDFLDFAIPIYWGENEYTDYKQILELYLEREQDKPQQPIEQLKQADVIKSVCLDSKYAINTVCVRYNDDGTCRPCGFCK